MTDLPVRVDQDAAMPLWAQIAEQLRWLIVDGALADGDRLPAVRALAGQLGVNLHTVRVAYRALEDEGLVLARRGVGTVVADYERGVLGRTAPDLPSFTIGVVLAGYSPFYAPLLDGIEIGVRARRSMMLLANAHDDDAAASAHLDHLAVRGVDGAIVVSVGLDPPPQGAGPPLVIADRPGASERSVSFRIGAGVAEAVRHLTGHGHRRVGLLAPPDGWNNARQIRDGYREGLTDAGLDPASPIVGEIEGYAVADGRDAASRLLERGEPPTALVAASDVTAVGAIEAVRSSGRTVPDDVAVIGTGDIELAGALSPPLSTIALPAGDMGRAAVTMLDELIRTGTADGPVELPTRLVTRESCGCGLSP